MAVHKPGAVINVKVICNSIDLKGMKQRAKIVMVETVINDVKVQLSVEINEICVMEVCVILEIVRKHVSKISVNYF